MRHSRLKQARKTLQFFRRTTNIQPPYHVLLDGTLVVALQRAKVLQQVTERLGRLLQGPSSTKHLSQQQRQQHQLYMTQSSVHELQQLADATSAGAGGGQKKERADDEDSATTATDTLFQDALDWAQQHCHIVRDLPEAPAALEQAKSEYVPRQPGQKRPSRKRKYHKDTDFEWTVAQSDLLRLATHAVVAAAGDGSSFIQKDNSKQQQQPVLYVVATQDEAVLHVLRSQFAIPLVRWVTDWSVLLLEPPSPSVLQHAESAEQSKWSSTTEERDLVQLAQSEQRAQEQQKHKAERQKQLKKQQRLEPFQKPKRKAKGPNPLSCLKKKTTPNDEDGGGKRGRRGRKRLKTNDNSVAADDG